MLNILSPTLFATMVLAFFVIFQLCALLAAQNNLMLADGQCGSGLGDFDPRSSTAADDQQNTTYLEHPLAERDLEKFFSRNVIGPLPSNADVNKELPERPGFRESDSEKPANVMLIMDDHTWLAQIGVGTPPQSVLVEVDPGLSDSWVFTTEFRDQEYSKIQKYHSSVPEAADKEKPVANSFHLRYLNRRIGVSGYAQKDAVTLGTEVKLMQQYFGCATRLEQPQPPRAPKQAPRRWFFGGALGLNYTISSPVLKQPSFMYNAVSEKAIHKPIFAFYLSKVKGRSRLHLGGTNKDFYTGDIQYYPAILTWNPTFISGFKRHLYWIESGGQINVNEKNGLLMGVKAAVDVRTYLIKGPPTDVKTVYESIGVAPDKINGQYVFPCDEQPSVRFQWGGKEWEISPENFKIQVQMTPPRCTGIIQADARLQLRKWILGYRFMMGVYTVYNPETQEIGFGTLRT